MDNYNIFPEITISNSGIISDKMKSLGIRNFREACRYIHELPYGYNSTRDDVLILFKEGFGTCSTKHGTIAILSEEIGIPVYRMMGIYAMNERLVTGVDRILMKYDLPYIPMIHCFLVYESYRVDLTEGNNNGKNCSIDDFLFTEKVKPNISEKEEYLIYRIALKENIINREEMQGIDLTSILQARTEGIELLKSKIST